MIVVPYVSRITRDRKTTSEAEALAARADDDWLTSTDEVFILGQ
jgi:hypothetical protein